MSLFTDTAEEKESVRLLQRPGSPTIPCRRSGSKGCGGGGGGGGLVDGWSNHGVHVADEVVS